MACSVSAKKITLQIISGFYLLGSIIAIAGGVVLLLDLKASSRKYDFNRHQLDEAEISCWILIAIGFVMAIFSIFGIYSVAKERAGKVKAYWIIHVVLLVLSVLGLFARFSLNGIFSILLSIAAIYLSIELEKEFRKKFSNTINPA